MERKIFMFYTSKEKFIRRSGGTEIELSIYKIENNIPESIGKVECNTASYRGTKSEVFNFLINKGLIEGEMGYYRDNDTNPYKIIELENV